MNMATFKYQVAIRQSEAKYAKGAWWPCRRASLTVEWSWVQTLLDAMLCP